MMILLFCFGELRSRRIRQGCVSSFTGIGEKIWRWLLRNEKTQQMRSCKLTSVDRAVIWGHAGFGARLVMLHVQAGDIDPDAIPGCHDGVEARGRQVKGQVPTGHQGVMVSCNALSLFPAQPRVSNPTIEGMESLPADGVVETEVCEKKALSFVRSFRNVRLHSPIDCYAGRRSGRKQEALRDDEVPFCPHRAKVIWGGVFF